MSGIFLRECNFADFACCIYICFCLPKSDAKITSWLLVCQHVSTKTTEEIFTKLGGGGRSAQNRPFNP